MDDLLLLGHGRIDLAIGGYGQERLVKRRLTGPGGDRILGDGLEGRAQHLDPLVPGVGHVDLALRIDCKPYWLAELTGLRPLSAATPQIVAVLIEDLNALVASIRHE